MAPHRALELGTFVRAVSPSYLRRFFRLFDEQGRLDAWAELNPDALEAALNQPVNAQLRDPITGEIRRINDLCAR